MESTETGEDGSSNKKSKFIDQSNSPETVHSQIQADSVVQKRKDRVTETEKTKVSDVICLGLVCSFITFLISKRIQVKSNS